MHCLLAWCRLRRCPSSGCCQLTPPVPVTPAIFWGTQSICHLVYTLFADPTEPVSYEPLPCIPSLSCFSCDPFIAPVSLNLGELELNIYFFDPLFLPPQLVSKLHVNRDVLAPQPVSPATTSTAVGTEQVLRKCSWICSEFYHSLHTRGNYASTRKIQDKKVISVHKNYILSISEMRNPIVFQ